MRVLHVGAGKQKYCHLVSLTLKLSCFSESSAHWIWNLLLTVPTVGNVEERHSSHFPVFHEFLSDVLSALGLLVFELPYQNLTEFITTFYISHFIGSRW